MAGNLVHPHPRGEARVKTGSMAPLNGSPPPAWGSQARMYCGASVSRFTPGRVGKPPPPLSDISSYPVHPQPRGEDQWRRKRNCYPNGSPAPAWGRREVLAQRLSRIAVHPHPRWETVAMRRVGRSPTGSPSPAWGSLRDALRDTGELRFSLNRVGKPRARGTRTCRASVHPHPRGEAVATAFTTALSLGSPPPAWGSHLRFANLGGLDRFTPTHVGKPHPRARSKPSVPVHPHPRGEACA